MLLGYSDESYDANRYWIAALLVPDEEASALTRSLDEVVASARAYGVHPHAELHGYEIFHGAEDWAPMAVEVRARIAVYARALRAIADRAFVIIRGVNRKRLVQRYRWPDHPHAVVWQHLLERVDEFADSRNENVLLIADEVDDAAAYRRHLWQFQRQPTSGYRSRQLVRTLDTVHFAPSHASRLLQAADLCAYLVRRLQSGQDTDVRAKSANAKLYDLLAPAIVHQWCWDP